jgi:hypothetical protein
MFTGKVSLQVLGSWPYPQTLDYTEKAYYGQTLLLIMKKGVTYSRKKFFNICL